MSNNTTKLKGQTVNLLDSLPKPGDTAFDFTYVKPDLTEGSLYDHEG